MPQKFDEKRYDVLVVGGGSAGIASAIAAARNGARTLLVEAGPMIGGELVSGIPIDGCVNTRGEWVVGGIVRELFTECDRLGGYIGPIFDYRALNVVCIDPEIMKVAVVNLVRKAGVDLLLYTFADDVVVSDDGVVQGVFVINKRGRTLIRATTVIDCSGDADLVASAGGGFDRGDHTRGEMQPVTLVFRMVGVETEPLLAFVRDNPENFGLAEYPDMGMSRADAAAALYRQGQPKVFLVSDGPLMQKALQVGDIHRSSMIAVTPLSQSRKEVGLNTTRLGNIDATNTDDLSAALPELMEQVWTCASFMNKYVPGFENAVFSGLAPRIGIRETRRIVGDYVLTGDDILEARKTDLGIAKGCHELDIHGSGTLHRRQTIRDGGSYDIPFGCLIPAGLKNVLVAGRCLSATREAHSSARVMGTCMAMGQAAGTAAAMRAGDGSSDVRDIKVPALRSMLADQGAVLDGTH